MHPDFFSLCKSDVLEQARRFNPKRYAATRNFLTGSVTRWSPFISRGVVSIRTLAQIVLSSYRLADCEKFIQELAWREYFQRVWEAKGDLIFTDLKYPQQPVAHHDLPEAVYTANTGIEAIDEGIRLLFESGYMHNHLRMYLASICCNVGKAHWLTPARWMYYHLLDGDPASNALSWQWVSGSFAAKKYYANQENINRYTGSNQQSGFLHTSYEILASMDCPPELQKTIQPDLKTASITTTLPADTQANRVLIYTSFNLDPDWRANEDGIRVWLVEPGHIDKYPVSPRVMSWLTHLANQIPGLTVFYGSFNELAALFPAAEIRYKKHPTTAHFTGQAEEPDWLFPDVRGYYPSFSAYWRICEKRLKTGGTRPAAQGTLF